MSDPWSAPPARRSDPRQEARGRTLTGNPAGRGGPGDGGAAPEGFESSADRLRRVLRTRPAEPWTTRTARQLSGLFRADTYPDLLIQAAAGAQSPVTTGRRIAVLGTRGGSGRTTTTAVLARLFAALRQDTVAAVDASSGRGTLGLRLGAEHAPALDAVAAALGGRIPASLAELARLMAPATANLLVTGPARGPFGSADLEPVSTAVSRYCPVALYDAGSGTGADGTAVGLPAGMHAAVFVAPASVAGLEDALWHAGAWEADPLRRHLPLLTVITQTDAGGPFDPVAEAARLECAGVRALALRYDRHLAGGVELDLALLSRPVRLEATTIAARILAAAGGHG